MDPQYLNPPKGGWQGEQPPKVSVGQPKGKTPAFSGGNRFAALSKGRTKKRGEMNKNEARYAEHLDAQQAAGEIVRYWFEPFSLRLSSPPTGQPARYTPDFLVLMPDGTTYVDDAKNKSIDDKAAIVRIKAADELFPLWIFRLVRPKAKKDGGGWSITEV